MKKSVGEQQKGFIACIRDRGYPRKDTGLLLDAEGNAANEKDMVEVQ